MIKNDVIVEDFYSNRPVRLYKGIAPTIRSERMGLKVIEDMQDTEHDDELEMSEVSKNRICKEDTKEI